MIDYSKHKYDYTKEEIENLKSYIENIILNIINEVEFYYTNENEEITIITKEDFDLEISDKMLNLGECWYHSKVLIKLSLFDKYQRHYIKESIIKTFIHELTHYIQYKNNLLCNEKGNSITHGKIFKQIEKDLRKQYVKHYQLEDFKYYSLISLYKSQNEYLGIFESDLKNTINRKWYYFKMNRKTKKIEFSSYYKLSKSDDLYLELQKYLENY